MIPPWYFNFNVNIACLFLCAHSISCCLLQCYIQYMQFGRRAEGVKSARAIFKMAREDKRSSYHVFVAAALLEFYCSKVMAVFTIPNHHIYVTL